MSFVDSRDRAPNDRSLVWRSGRPGLHALIAGVSNYPNLPGPSGPPGAVGFGMVQLTSTALTAYLMYEWLIGAHEAGQLPYPLSTCRVLLAPQPEEVAASTRQGPGIAALGAPGCSVATLQEAAAAWRADAAQRRDDASLFYFAGHGIQKSRNDQVLLLDTFGAPGPLASHSVDVNSLRNGMAPTQAHPEIARVQFYFVDACRNMPPGLTTFEDLKVSPVFDVVRSGIDDRRAPIFFASLPDGKAQAVRGEQTLFSLALRRCLAGRAAFPPDQSAQGRARNEWYVSTQSLAQGFRSVLGEVNRQYQGDQRWTMDGSGEDAVLCFLPGAPTVPLQIEVDPAEAVASTEISVRGPYGGGNRPPNVLRCPPQAHPFLLDLPAGFYEIEPVLHTPDPRFVAPGKFPWMVEPLRAFARVRMEP